MQVHDRTPMLAELLAIELVEYSPSANLCAHRGIAEQVQFDARAAAHCHAARVPFGTHTHTHIVAALLGRADPGWLQAALSAALRHRPACA